MYQLQTIWSSLNVTKCIRNMKNDGHWWKAYTCISEATAPDKAHKINFNWLICVISSPNPMFHHLLESSWWQEVKHRIWWRNRHYMYSNIYCPVWGALLPFTVRARNVSVSATLYAYSASSSGVTTLICSHLWSHSLDLKWVCHAVWSQDLDLQSVSHAVPTALAMIVLEAGTGVLFSSHLTKRSSWDTSSPHLQI